MSTSFKANNIIEAHRKAREILFKKMGSNYKKRGRTTGTIVSYITVYQKDDDPTDFICYTAVQASCHGSALGGTAKGYSRLFNISLPAIRIWEGEEYEAAEKYLEYLINRSYLAPYYKTKSVKNFIEIGGVVSAPDVNVCLVHSAYQSARMPREYIDGCVVFKRAVEAGMLEPLAFIFAYFTRLADDDKLEITTGRNHTNLHPDQTNFRNLVKVNPVGASSAEGSKYKSATTYSGVYALFGKQNGKYARFAAFFKELSTKKTITDIWGDEYTQETFILDPATIEKANNLYLKIKEM